MLFNSYEFIFIFLPIVLIIYFNLNRFGKYNLSKGWLVLASLYFYSYFHKSYLILIISSILFNYFIGYKLNKSDKNRNMYLILGVTFNLGTLGYFKYYDFFVKNINILFRTDFNLVNILLPLGISFFTFQQLSFVIDSYNKKSLHYDFLSYALFVTFFPQLIAGPIVTPSEMLPQFEDKKNKLINYENMNRGLYIFSIGLAKKVILADSIASFANTGFDKMQSLTFVEAWLSSISYTLQLYFDFSGYCDMAMGIALMFNILLPINFNSPYKSLDIQEFWQRWHMTLGRFMKNYLYIPLGGNKNGELKTYRNLWIVFLVSGLWHGAGWNFIIWGAIHGLGILIHRTWHKTGYKLNKFIAWFITFNLVNILWVFFRATTFKGAIKVLNGMFNINNFSLGKEYIMFCTNVLTPGNRLEIMYIVLIISIIICFFLKNTFYLSKNKLNIKSKILYTSFLFSFSILFLERVVTFLYFNF